ncbi:uncharacterized protein LOC110111628 [Dendrobium catenatum]|uniref:uncharacterized protein LOC110111628 n=1 Tax=Dendrobium catenatum TaxID=906689 RepID=UPI0009F497F6|nr:uncharacterized protein LOC110111628 [Dendrobium catenatum]
MPTLWFSEDEFLHLAKPFEFALVGKFPLKRPALDSICRLFFNLKLSGNFSVTLLDQANMLIKLSNDLDYGMVFAHRSYFVYGYFKKVIKWSPLLDLLEESTIIPVWLSFPGLRPHLFSSRILFGLGLIFGRPIQNNNATASGSRPSVARVHVEIDVSKSYHDTVWLGPEKLGYVQKIVFEGVPNYCQHCKFVGHKKSECPKLFPNLHQVDASVPQPLASVSNPLLNSSIPVTSSVAIVIPFCDNNASNGEFVSDQGVLNCDININAGEVDALPFVDCPVISPEVLGPHVPALVVLDPVLIPSAINRSRPPVLSELNVVSNVESERVEKLNFTATCSNNLIGVPVNLVDTRTFANQLGDNSGFDIRNHVDWLHGSSEYESESDFSDFVLTSPEFCGGSVPGNEYSVVRDRPVCLVASRVRFRGRGRRKR